MNNHQIALELEEIHYKYERITSLIDILQILTAKIVEINEVPKDSLANALYEIELAMDDNNERLKAVFTGKAVYHE